MSVILTMDVVTTEALMPMLPHENVYDMSAPRKISGNPAISKPVVMTIANALSEKRVADPAKLARMKEIFKL
jgi:hypothetical protein